MSEGANDNAATATAGDRLRLADVAGIARLEAVHAAGRLVLRAGGPARERIGEALGLDLARPVGTATAGEGMVALRLGPDEWWLLAEAGGDPWLAARLADAAGPLPISVVDVSHRNLGFGLAGPAVEAVLAAGCPLPLDPIRFPVGRATRTLLAKAEIVLWRRGSDRFHIEVARSLAPYVVAFLGEAMADEAAVLARPS